MEHVTERQQQLVHGGASGPASCSNSSNSNRPSNASNSSYNGGRSSQAGSGMGAGPGPGSGPRLGRLGRQATEQLCRSMRRFESEAISMIVDAMEGEHEHLRGMVLGPLAAFVCEALPAPSRASSPGQLSLRDLDLMLPEQVRGRRMDKACIKHWFMA